MKEKVRVAAVKAAGAVAATAGVIGAAGRAWAGGLVQPPQIDITNGTMNLNSGAGQTLSTQISTWLSVVAIIAVLGIGANLAHHAWKLSHGDERVRADAAKGIMHSIFGLIIVASLWLIVSAVIGMV
jgi:hypothetical protein